MILVLLFIASFSPYVYSDLPLPEFNSKTVNFSTQSIKGKYGSDMNSFYTIRADARLRFHDLSFGVHALKLHLQNQDYNNLSYSFQWYFIENAIVSIFDLSTNFGYFFNDSKYSILNHYYSHFFSNWFVSNRFKVRGSPIYFLATVYDSYQDHLFYKGVLGINSDFGQVFLEYDSLLPTLFLGVAQKLNSRLILNLSINLNAIYLNDYQPMFSPEIKLDLSFFDLFFNQTKPKPKGDFFMNSDTFLWMEKAILAYSKQDYVSAANFYNQVLIKFPYFTLANVRLANCYYKMRQWGLADHFWRKALVLDPSNDSVFMALTQLRERLSSESFYE